MLRLRESKAQKGITLIALIMTIVLLLILASVTILSIKDNKLISKAQNTADRFYETQQNMQVLLNELKENTVTGTGGSGSGESVPEPEIPGGGSGDDTDSPVITVEPTVGKYVKYNVSYTDMYSSSKTFGETDGWRYLGKDEAENHLMISTGIPMKLFYHNSLYGENAKKWWDPADTLGPNRKAINGMQNNFDKIPFAQKASGTEMRTDEANTAIGAFAPKRITCNGETLNYDAVGNYFKATGQPYTSKILKVRTLTLAELNRATNKANGNNNRSETSKSESFKDLEGTAKGLFDLQDLTGYTGRYYYWLASPLNANLDSILAVYCDESEIGSHPGNDAGVRPVVVLSSGTQFTDADGDGVLEIN